MKKIYSFLLLLIILSCKKVDCGYLEFNAIDKLTYKNNQLYTGKCVSYYSNSEIESIREYKNGKDHGNWTFYFENKNIATIGRLENGVKIGKWEYFFETGETKYIQSYDSMGNKDSLWIELSKTGDTISSIKY
jgi:antitoxin component YwqK of YwqJK toxin-antitoxin module